MQEIKIFKEGINLCGKTMIFWKDVANWRDSKEKIVNFENNEFGKTFLCPIEDTNKRNGVSNFTKNFFIIYLKNGKVIRLEDFELIDTEGKKHVETKAEDKLKKVFAEKVKRKMGFLLCIDKISFYSIILALFITALWDALFYLSFMDIIKFDFQLLLFLFSLVFYLIIFFILYFFGELGKDLRKRYIKKRGKND